MMSRLSLNLTFVLLLALASCSEENPRSSQFIIISNAGSPANGIVSTYSYPSKNFVEEAYRFTSGSFRATVTDAILSDGELYALKRDDSPMPDQIEVVNTSNWSLARSAKLFLVSGFCRIITHHDKVLVAGSDFDGDMHLLVFNKKTLLKEDSIYLKEYVEIRKMIVQDNKIFISYSFIDGEPKILILSSTTYGELKEIDIPDICEDLVIDLDGNVLAFFNQGFIKINSSTLESTLEQIPYANVFPGQGGSSFGFDRKKNIIYYFSYAAQPAPAFFHLAAFNLGTELPVEIPHEFIDASSITFNNSINQVIMGSHHYATNQGVVRLCNKNGEVLSDFFVPGTPLEILFK
jgi:hypothetical protein